jgi:soluble lytic murein transglycosylase-like protein
MKKLIFSILVVLIVVLYYPVEQKVIVKEIKPPIYEIQKEKLALYISKKYKVHKANAKLIVDKAFEHSNPIEFPTPIDTLAIIAIESSYKIYAVSKVGAKGLMQILYKPSSFLIDENIKDGVALLKDYKKATGSIPATIQAYNIGIGNYNRNIRNEEYFNKYKQAKKELENI